MIYLLEFLSWLKRTLIELLSRGLKLLLDTLFPMRSTTPPASSSEPESEQSTTPHDLLSSLMSSVKEASGSGSQASTPADGAGSSGPVGPCIDLNTLLARRTTNASAESL